MDYTSWHMADAKWVVFPEVEYALNRCLNFDVVRDYAWLFEKADQLTSSIVLE